MNRRRFLKSSAVGTMLIGGGITPAIAALHDDIKIAMSTPGDLTRNGIYLWAREFSKTLETSGQNVRIYPNGGLGGERERVFQTQLNLLEINITGGDEIARWSPHAYALSRPFTVSTYAHMDRFLTTTPFMERVSASLAKHDLKLIDYLYTGSMVGLFTRATPVRTLDELRPLRLRILSSADQDLLRAWNVRGVQVAWEEVAQALQTGMVDAYLNPPNVATMFGHGSVLNYFTNLGMGPASRIVVASKRWLDELPSTFRDTLEESFKKARTANRLWVKNAIAEDRGRLEATGIEWIELTVEERAEWISASAEIPLGRWEQAEHTAEVKEWINATRTASP